MTPPGLRRHYRHSRRWQKISSTVPGCHTNNVSNECLIHQGGTPMPRKSNKQASSFCEAVSSEGNFPGSQDDKFHLSHDFLSKWFYNPWIWLMEMPGDSRMPIWLMSHLQTQYAREPRHHYACQINECKNVFSKKNKETSIQYTEEIHIWTHYHSGLHLLLAGLSGAETPRDVIRNSFSHLKSILWPL